MTDAWLLYDRMIDRIPEDVLVRSVVMGAHHCLVEAECGAGVAALHRGGVRLRLERGWAGRPLCELAACAKSWDFEVASVGVAALNAWHNQCERIGELSLVTDAGSTGPVCVPGPGGPAHGGREGRRLAAPRGGGRPLSAPCGHRGSTRTSPCWSAPPAPTRTCRTPPGEYLLPGADLAVMTGMALANKTLPRLLELSRGALTCVVGPSATMCAPVLEAGSDLVAGSVVADAALAREVVSCGAPLHGSGALEHVLVATTRGCEALADQP